MATKVLRAVLDTNVVVAALRSRHEHSPAAELIHRWLTDEFVLLYSRTIRAEYAKTLNGLEADSDKANDFLDNVLRFGIRVPIRIGQIKPVTLDPKDDVFVACALIGQATHLVSYDPHILNLGENFRGLKILEPLPFLQDVRSDQPPDL